MSDSTNENKGAKERSPSFPAISLETSLAQLEAFETMFSRHDAPYKKAGLAWGFKENSSQANRQLAALKAFGLLEYKGVAKDRVVAISNSGRTYLRAQQDSIKTQVIRDAALRPKAFAKFWPDWGADRPIDAICLDALVLHHGFTESAARKFLKVYDETIAYAGLGDSDKSLTIESEQEGTENSINEQNGQTEYGGAEVGDLVQREHNGVLTFDSPKRVRAIQDADGQEWVFVDGTETGFEMEQVIVTEKSKGGAAQPPVLPLPDAKPERKEGFTEEATDVDEGEVVLTLPEKMSAESYNDLKMWFDYILRKHARRAGVAAKKDANN